MHVISYDLLAPTILVLLMLVLFAVYQLGGLLVEAVTERRRFKIEVPVLLDTFQRKDAGSIEDEIVKSRLFKRQKTALIELIRHSHLPASSLQALARQLLSSEELHYAKGTGKTDMVARLGPMLGLMATLIPLGPGLIAMGEGDTKTLAESLLTAFDATVLGLAAAGVSYFISRVRKRWYEGYLSSLEALMEGLLEVFVHGRGFEEEKA
jgi:biopolymer transport protein ExbB/TolQ